MEGQGVYSPKEQYKQMFIEAVGKRSGSMVMWQVLDEIGFFNSPASANHHLNVPGGHAARCLQGWEVHCKAGGWVSVQRHPDAGAW